MGYSASIGSTVAGDERLGRQNFAVRVVDMRADTVAGFTKSFQELAASPVPHDAKTVVMLPKLVEFGKRLIKEGASLVVDDISMAWRGNTSSLKGRIGFGKVADADFDVPQGLLKKLVMRLDVSTIEIKDGKLAFNGKLKSINGGPPGDFLHLSFGSRPKLDKSAAGAHFPLWSLTTTDALTIVLAEPEKFAPAVVLVARRPVPVLEISGLRVQSVSADDMAPVASNLRFLTLPRGLNYVSQTTPKKAAGRAVNIAAIDLFGVASVIHRDAAALPADGIVATAPANVRLVSGELFTMRSEVWEGDKLLSRLRIDDVTFRARR